MYFVCTASCTTSQPQDGDHIKDDGESIIDQSCLQWWKSQNRTWYQTTSAATPLSLKEKKSTPCFMCGGYSCQTITQNNGGDDGIDVCVIFLGSSWVLLLVVQGAVVAVASTPRATQSSARLRRRGSLACLLAGCRWESKKWMRRRVLFGGSFFASSISTFQWVSHNRSGGGGASQYTLQVLRCFHACFKTLQWRFHWVKKS